MKILIDNSNLFAGGGIQVATSFLNDLRELGLNHNYHIIQSKNFARGFTKDNFPNNFEFYELGEKEEKYILKRRKTMLNLERKICPNVIFTVFGPSYHRSKYPKIVGMAIPYLIYPDSPFFESLGFKEKMKYRIFSVLKSLFFKNNSDALIFESEIARKIFIEKYKYNKPTYTVNNTLNSIFLEKDKWQSIDLCQDRFNILCLSANYPHKNLNIIPKLIELIKAKNPSFRFTFNISASIEDFSWSESTCENVNFLGHVPLEKIPDLYLKSDLLFFPTLLEVFSTTYLEALQMGVPIVTSDMPFSKDICDTGAIYCNPTDPNEYAEAILNIFMNYEIRRDLINEQSIIIKKFATSKERTRNYLSIIEKTYSYENKK